MWIFYETRASKPARGAENAFNGIRKIDFSPIPRWILIILFSRYARRYYIIIYLNVFRLENDGKFAYFIFYASTKQKGILRIQSDRNDASISQYYTHSTSTIHIEYFTCYNVIILYGLGLSLSFFTHPGARRNFRCPRLRLLVREKNDLKHGKGIEPGRDADTGRDPDRKIGTVVTAAGYNVTITHSRKPQWPRRKNS